MSAARLPCSTCAGDVVGWSLSTAQVLDGVRETEPLSARPLVVCAACARGLAELATNAAAQLDPEETAAAAELHALAYRLRGRS